MSCCEFARYVIVSEFVRYVSGLTSAPSQAHGQGAVPRYLGTHAHESIDAVHVADDVETLYVGCTRSRPSEADCNKTQQIQK